MTSVLVVSISSDADGLVATGVVAAVLGAQTFRALNDKVGTSLVQSKSNDWLDSLVGRVGASKVEKLAIKDAYPDAGKALLFGKNSELVLSFDTAVALAVAGDDVQVPATQLSLAEQIFATSPDSVAGFVLDGMDEAIGSTVAEKAGLCYFSSGSTAKDTEWLAVRQSPHLSLVQLRFNLIDFARKADKCTVLLEGSEPRTVEAAVICHEGGAVHCVLLAEQEGVETVAKERGVTLPDSLEIADPASLAEQYVTPICEPCRPEGSTPEDIRRQLRDTVTLDIMITVQDDVDGLVSGTVHTIANTIHPALQLIKTVPGASLASSVFFILLPSQVLVSGDCAVNPNSTAEQLAGTAIQSADSAKTFGIKSEIVLTLYPIANSGSGPDVDIVVEVARLTKERRPDLAIGSLLQYDAATAPDVAESKASSSSVAGQATILVFLDPNAGDCTYKTAQRTTNVLSVDPSLQGLYRPVNDLSCGALVDDIVYTIALTVVQVKQMKGRYV